MIGSRIMFAPARGRRSALAALAATLALAWLAGSSGWAQQPPAAAPRTKAAPKAKPKQPPAPQAQAAQPVQPPQLGQASAGSDQRMPVVYSPWTKLCHKQQTQAGEKDICATTRDVRLETGQFLAGATLIEVQGEAMKLMRVTLPLGMQLPQGSRFAVDKDPPAGAPYFVCVPDGCLAQTEVNAEFIAKLKQGQLLVLQGINPSGQVATYQIPLSEFAKANEGPATDPQVLAEQQKKLQEQLQRRAMELSQKPDRQDGTPGSGAK